MRKKASSRDEVVRGSRIYSADSDRNYQWSYFGSIASFAAGLSLYLVFQYKGPDLISILAGLAVLLSVFYFFAWLRNAIVLGFVSFAYLASFVVEILDSDPWKFNPLDTLLYFHIACVWIMFYLAIGSIKAPEKREKSGGEA